MGQYKWTCHAKVVEVVDGDTLKLDLDLGFHLTLRSRVRIIGINAPEMTTPEGVAAKAFAETVVSIGDDVMFHSSTLDKWGRPLGTVSITTPNKLRPEDDGLRDFGQAMLDAGHAVELHY